MRRSEEYRPEDVVEMTFDVAAVSHMEYAGCGSHQIRISVLLWKHDLAKIRDAVDGTISPPATSNPQQPPNGESQ